MLIIVLFLFFVSEEVKKIKLFMVLQIE